MRPSKQKAGTSQPVSGSLFTEILLKHQTHTETYIQPSKQYEQKNRDPQCTIILYFHRCVKLQEEEPKPCLLSFPLLSPKPQRSKMCSRDFSVKLNVSLNL